MKRLKLRVVSVLLVTALVYITLFQRTFLTDDEVHPVAPRKSHSGTSKLILAYTNVYGREFNITSYGRTGYEMNREANPLASCEYRCEWSTNKEDYTRSDAVLFHLYNNHKNKDFRLAHLPKRFSSQQKWIFMAREPQAFYYPEQLKLLNDSFNLTMTFQSDSDVVIPYGTFWRHPTASQAYKASMKLDYLSGKTKLVAWLVSNCKTSSRREEFVKQLQQHIPIDVYGKCGNLTTDTNSANGFRDEIAKKYMFYIAFENSDCDDYISEKFWNSLHIGIIPIVRGQRGKYKKFAPPNSYIHADAFVAPELLANHLKEISKNSTLFHKYHEWRRHYDANYKFFTTNSRWMCDLCDKVHNSKPQTVNIYNHFSEDSRCFTYLDHQGRDRYDEHVEDIS